MTVYHCNECGQTHNTATDPACPQTFALTEVALVERDERREEARHSRLQTKEMREQCYQGNVFHASPRNFGRKPRGKKPARRTP